MKFLIGKVIGINTPLSAPKHFLKAKYLGSWSCSQSMFSFSCTVPRHINLAHFVQV
jgi:hypothetical protein